MNHFGLSEQVSRQPLSLKTQPLTIPLKFSLQLFCILLTFVFYFIFLCDDFSYVM